MKILEKNLNSSCSNDGYCQKSECQEIAKEGPLGQFYITMGHAGFNSPTNNRQGYKSKEAAIKASKKYASK